MENMLRGNSIDAIMYWCCPSSSLVPEKRSDWSPWKFGLGIRNYIHTRTHHQPPSSSCSLVRPYLGDCYIAGDGEDMRTWEWIRGCRVDVAHKTMDDGRHLMDTGN